MNLTREEVCNTLKEVKNYIESDNAYLDCRKAIAGLDAALAALRPISREQEPKVWKGKWNYRNTKTDHLIIAKCSKCGYEISAMVFFVINRHFCTNCGAPMTDHAVQIVMERLEELNNA